MGKSLRGKRLKRLGLFWVGVFLSFSLWAQTGVICGTVTDAKMKEPLIGASVVIEGTTVGAITDIDGNFRIENVRPGTYTVAASYVSYQTQTVKDVPVVARQEAVLNIELSDANLQLQNVVVVAQRKLGTEMAVLNTVRKSLPVVNGISAQQISKTQDSDAGFRGYRDNGDKPMILRTKLNYELKKNILSFQYKHGMKDHLYDSYSLAYIRCF